MKFFIFVLTMSLLTSCGKKSKESTSKNVEALNHAESLYGLPTIGFQKSVKLNYRFAHVYENLSIDPAGKKEVLGEMPFFLFLNEDNSIELNVYSRTDLKSVGHLDLGDKFETTQFKNISDVTKNSNFILIHNFERRFTYGRSNPSAPEQDMLNKIFVIETEMADLPHVGKAQIMFWVTCEGGLRFKGMNDYQCGPGNLVFNYRLLDYKLEQ